MPILAIPDLDRYGTPTPRGLYIWKYPLGEGGISADVIWGNKYENTNNKKGEYVKEKGRKGEEKGRKGKENEKRGSKRVK